MSKTEHGDEVFSLLSALALEINKHNFLLISWVLGQLTPRKIAPQT